MFLLQWLSVLQSSETSFFHTLGFPIKEREAATHVTCAPQEKKGYVCVTRPRFGLGLQRQRISALGKNNSLKGGRL